MGIPSCFICSITGVLVVIDKYLFQAFDENKIWATTLYVDVDNRYRFFSDHLFRTKSLADQLVQSVFAKGGHSAVESKWCNGGSLEPNDLRYRIIYYGSANREKCNDCRMETLVFLFPWFNQPDVQLGTPYL